MTERLFSYFNDELNSLRDLGGRFAAQHPKIAGRLRLSSDSVDDPHVARLIESFAFIAARLRLKLDDDFPELTETLLEFLYPHYLAPVPSLCIAAIDSGHDLTGPAIVERGTLVESEPIEGDICRFRTTQKVELWPITVTHASQASQPAVAPHSARFDAAAVLRLVLECRDPDMTFTKLGVDRLRFYIRAQWRQAISLYELLLNECMGVAFADFPEDQNAVFVGPEALQPVGFDDEEAALPPAPRSHPAFRLLTEFFAFPEKFLFFDLSRLSAKVLQQAGNRLEIFFYLKRHVPELDRAIAADMFALDCTPIVNLFTQRAEPIVLSRAVSEYAIVPDARRHATREVYSVDDVILVDRTGSSQAASPLFGRRVDQADALPPQWQLRRRFGAGETSTDARLAFVDPAERLDSSVDSVLTVETTCLNRDLASRLPYGGNQPVLTMKRSVGDGGRLRALTPFTSTIRLKNDEGLLWRLLSHLKLGHLSLVGDANGPEPLREMMRLYDHRDGDEIRALIEAIIGVRSRRSTARLSNGGLARGLDVDVEIDSRTVEPGVAFLFGQVLDRFLGLYVNLNSFTRLSIRTKGAARPIKTWAPRSGAKILS